MKRATVVTGAAVAVVLMAGCTATESGTEPTGAEPTSTEPASAEPTGADGLLAAHGLDGLDDTQQVIERLEAMPVADRPTDLLASVRPDAVILSGDAGEEVSLPLPDGEFYVSIAPYVDETHECFFHSLTTCRGELRNEELQVQVTDRADGATLVDETLSTNDNGFLGLWLPRDIDATISIAHSDDRSIRANFSTSEDDPTCLTTLQLA